MKLGKIEFTRRTLLLSSAAILDSRSWGKAPPKMTPGHVLLTDESRSAKNIRLHVPWRGDLCAPYVVNKGRTPERIKEIVLFSFRHGLPASTPFYGEGFTMLSETTGTLDQPVSISPYQDAKHYRIPEPADARAYYGMLLLAPVDTDRVLLAFTSCQRFSGKFYVRNGSIDVVVDTENLELAPGERWPLEQLMVRSGGSRGTLLEALADNISVNHPPQLPSAPPAGWCSWYMMAGRDGIVGTSVTADQVLSNLDFITGQLPQLRYVQIDEGYSSTEGDWLTSGSSFNGGVKEILKQIRERGFEPAIWVAPFIAESASKVFQEHPNWFVQDKDGKPLRSDLVTFGGWHRGPWYAMDGTHPEVQKHLQQVFQVMREEWGCTYFKLDANFWGAMHGGRHYDANATRVEAYRRGMQAVRLGAGKGAFILGCNHPLWPSLGLISGSRSSNDIERTWQRFSETAKENLHRSWQNGKLWWLDPDCVLLTGDLPEAEYLFHATVAYACGGAILSGDNLPSIPPARLAILRKLLPPSGVCAVFEDESFSIGWIKGKGRRTACLLNWTEQEKSFSIPLDAPQKVGDYWEGTDLGVHEKSFAVSALPPHSGKILMFSPITERPGA